MFDAVRADAPDGDDQTLNLISVDSTSVRAHQHAAGARFSEDTGAGSNHKNLPGEPAHHALGRSRGGWTTKIHALTDALSCPVTVLLSAGQAGDNPYPVPLLKSHAEHGRGRFRLLADKAYSHPPRANTCER